jgi:hypothetical protein
MTEHIALELTAEEASRRIAADIRAYPQNGPDKREEHLRLFGVLLSRDDIEGAWAIRYTEIALAGKARLARVGARFDALQAKRKLAEPKVVGYRRFTAAKEQSSANAAVFFCARHSTYG